MSRWQKKTPGRITGRCRGGCTGRGKKNHDEGGYRYPGISKRVKASLEEGFSGETSQERGWLEKVKMRLEAAGKMFLENREGKSGKPFFKKGLEILGGEGGKKGSRFL